MRSGILVSFFIITSFISPDSPNYRNREYIQDIEDTVAKHVLKIERGKHLGKVKDDEIRIKNRHIDSLKTELEKTKP